METCADCGKLIRLDDPSYYRKDPTDDIGKTFHSTCGDPLGLKAKDAEIDRLDRAACALARENERLRAALKPFADAAKKFAPYPIEMDRHMVEVPFTLGQLRAAEHACEQKETDAKPNL